MPFLGPFTLHLSLYLSASPHFIPYCRSEALSTCFGPMPAVEHLATASGFIGVTVLLKNESNKIVACIKLMNDPTFTAYP